MTTSEFYQRYRGSFSGILKWPQLDEFWQQLRSLSDRQWYIYAIGDEPPERTVTHDELNRFIDEVDKLLRTEHKEDYCGVVYVDDKTNPSFVKIYDPNNLGVVCGFSDNPPLPGWILSTIQPMLLDKNTFMTGKRKRWWQRLFA